MGGGNGDVRRGCSSVAQQLRRHALYCRTSSCNNESKAHREQKQQRVQQERESKEYRSKWTSAQKISIATNAERCRTRAGRLRGYCCQVPAITSQKAHTKTRARIERSGVHRITLLIACINRHTHTHTHTYQHTRTSANRRKVAQKVEQGAQIGANQRKLAHDSWQRWQRVLLQFLK